jgi:hypothetical protein
MESTGLLLPAEEAYRRILGGETAAGSGARRGVVVGAVKTIASTVLRGRVTGDESLDVDVIYGSA